MADARISELPAVTTPAATDELPVNQGGTTRKVTRQQMHALESGEHLSLPQDNDPTTPTLRFGDLDTGLYEVADDQIGVAVATALCWILLATQFAAADAAGPALQNEAATATNPTLLPNKADADTGVGWNAADNLSLVAGGAEAVRVEDPADLAAGETSLWLFDFDNGTMEQVSVGAADSGGSGYKVLRIPN